MQGEVHTFYTKLQTYNERDMRPRCLSCSRLSKRFSTIHAIFVASNICHFVPDENSIKFSDQQPKAWQARVNYSRRGMIPALHRNKLVAP